MNRQDSAETQKTSVYNISLYLSVSVSGFCNVL